MNVNFIFFNDDLYVTVKNENETQIEQLTFNQSFKVYLENVEELVDHWDLLDAEDIADDIYGDIYGVDFDLDLTKKEENFIKGYLEDQVDQYLSILL